MNRPERLSQGFCRAVRQPGRYGDGRGGNGLSLVVRGRDGRAPSKSWVQQLWRQDRTTVNIGLGSFDAVTLAQARSHAASNAARLRAGEELREPRGLPPARRVPTVRQSAEAWFDLQRPKWKDDRNERGLRQRMEKHAAPLLDMRVDAPTRKEVLEALLQVELPATRERLLRNLRDIFNHAILTEWRTDNPADSAVAAALATGKRQAKHHASLPFAEIAGVLAQVDAMGLWPMIPLATRFVALTCARSGEVRGALWAEIDRAARTWTIPAARMKSARAFVVPLSRSAVDVLDRAAEHADGGPLVFPSARSGKPMNSARLSEAVTAATGATIHGLRASFRTWAAEASISRDVSEMVLAHALGNATELAYQRSDFFVARTAIMERWAAVVEGREEHAEIVELASRRA